MHPFSIYIIHVCIQPHDSSLQTFLCHFLNQARLELSSKVFSSVPISEFAVQDFRTTASLFFLWSSKRLRHTLKVLKEISRTYILRDGVCGQQILVLLSYRYFKRSSNRNIELILTGDVTRNHNKVCSSSRVQPTVLQLSTNLLKD
jgi:hypothetical protein